MVTPKKAKLKRKRGPKEERLIISEDPAKALEKLFKPQAPEARERHAEKEERLVNPAEPLYKNGDLVGWKNRKEDEPRRVWKVGGVIEVDGIQMYTLQEINPPPYPRVGEVVGSFGQTPVSEQGNLKRVG